MSNYLVTGGCGFIGSHLVDSLLQDGHKVRILDDLSKGEITEPPSASDLVIADVCDVSTVRKSMEGMDACFHLAAVESVQRSNEDWLATHLINMNGSINVLESARHYRIPVVYASSAAVYGDNAEMPLKEYASLRPLTAYGADKLGSELHARVASLVHQVPTIGLRFFNVYGPGQSVRQADRGVIPIFVDHLLKQETLNIFGDGQQTRDFVYVGDAVKFLREAMEKVKRTASVFNVCSGEPITINQLAHVLMSISGVQVDINYLPSRKGDIQISVGDPAYATRHLGISAKEPLLNGLREVIEDRKVRLGMDRPHEHTQELRYGLI